MGPELWCPAFCMPICVHIQAGPQPGINMSLRDHHHVSEGSSCICSSGSQKLCRHSAPETCRIARERRLEHFWDKGRLRVMSQHHFAVVLCWFFGVPIYRMASATEICPVTMCTGSASSVSGLYC